MLRIGKSEYCWIYGYDLDCEDEIQNQIIAGLKNSIETYKGQHPGTNGEVFEIYSGGVATARESFYTLYGGIFFLGIMLGIVFVFAAVLIVYYKQISEGYEDQSRFEIMQKVGMTKREIRKSINSQMLTVFFLPLVTAGVHLAFAFPADGQIDPVIRDRQSAAFDLCGGHLLRDLRVCSMSLYTG